MRIKTARGSRQQSTRPACDVPEALAVGVAETSTGWTPAAQHLFNETRWGTREQLKNRWFKASDLHIKKICVY